MPHRLKEMQENLMSKADNMAAAAVMFGSHGYDSFIHAREEFKTSLEEIELTLEEIERLAQEENERDSLDL